MNQDPYPYPHLSSELRRLTGDALRLWGDAGARREALEEVVGAWEAGSPDLERAIDRVDAAVVEGLRALGLPRGPVRDVRVDSGRPGLYGQKLHDSTLVLVGEYLRTFVRARDRADAAFRTWIHESFHARQPYALGASDEYRAFRGYEEGLVEGLTQMTLTAARIVVADAPFASYVASYGALATAAAVEVEALLRALWRSPTGEVRRSLPETVGALRRAATGRALSPEARTRLQAMGDTLFGTDRGNRTADPAVLATLWKQAFR